MGTYIQYMYTYIYMWCSITPQCDLRNPSLKSDYDLRLQALPLPLLGSIDILADSLMNATSGALGEMFNQQHTGYIYVTDIHIHDVHIYI